MKIIKMKIIIMKILIKKIIIIKILIVKYLTIVLKTQAPIYKTINRLWKLKKIILKIITIFMTKKNI
jgi:hypothetical protein